VAQGALASQLTAQARAEIEDQLGRLSSGLLTSWVSSTAAELLSGAGAPLPAVHGVSADGTGVRILFCVGCPCRCSQPRFVTWRVPRAIARRRDLG